MGHVVQNQTLIDPLSLGLNQKINKSIISNTHLYNHINILSFTHFKTQGNQNNKIRNNIKCSFPSILSSTGKVSDGYIRDLEFNPHLHKKLIGILI